WLSGLILRARLAFVYCEGFVVARYEYGVSSHAASGVAFSAAPSSPRSSYRRGIFPKKKSVSRPAPLVADAARGSKRGAEPPTTAPATALPPAPAPPRGT